eukprot:jgi/Chrzof1/3327/Cz12g21010.t1
MLRTLLAAVQRQSQHAPSCSLLVNQLNCCCDYTTWPACRHPEPDSSSASAHSVTSTRVRLLSLISFTNVRGISTAVQCSFTPGVESKVQALLTKYRTTQEQLSKGDVAPGTEQYLQLAKRESALRSVATSYQQLQSLQQQHAGLQELLDTESDDDLKQMALEEQQLLQHTISELQQSLIHELLPADESGSANVVLEIRAGVGGEWAADFANDLLRMYSQYAASQGWRVEVLEQTPTEMGGCKSASVLITGQGAYGQLRFESGVHRAQAVPFTEKNGKLQTGTATVAVLPDANEVDVRISESELKVDTYRSSGPGGQHVNTTDSAVRITHIPTGIVVQCQNGRSQHQNKAKAMSVLRARLHEHQMAKQAAEMNATRQAAVGQARFNERIRTYNYQEGRVSDHRIGVTVYGGVDRVLSGEGLVELIEALQQQRQQEQLAQLLESTG